ncbi:MAG TPA: arylsulfatase [Candidatus Paceibacterota bacterium]|nr:arylsulfatase [Candidatus Paceibacterota bacterium]
MTLLGCLSLGGAAAAPAVKRPNILFLMDDQHRGDWLGVAGAKWLITPNLDRLARDGVLFRRAYTSTPSCLPARAALLTGMSPWGHGSLGYVPIPERYACEMPRVFSEAGWRTCAIGKNHFAPPSNSHGYQTVIRAEPNIRDQSEICDYRAWFDRQAPGHQPLEGYRSGNDQRGGICYPLAEELHLTPWTADRALEALNSHKQGEPWFLKVSFLAPHTPLNAPKRWHDRYQNVDIPPAAIGDWARREYGGVQTSFAQHAEATRGVVPEEELRATRRSYAAAISFVDEQIGRILAALEERGESETTLILFTSDHGDLMGDHHVYRKTFPYEGSVNVPMIVRWPASLGLDARRGQVRQELVELRDVFPTFLDAAGLPRPASVEGTSLLDILRGKPGRKLLDLEHASCYAPKDGWVALMDQRYKYVYFVHTGQQQLFDLRRDQQELNNLAVKPAGARLVQQWRQKMIKHLSVRGEPWVQGGELTVLKTPIRRRANNPNVMQ